MSVCNGRCQPCWTLGLLFVIGFSASLLWSASVFALDKPDNEVLLKVAGSIKNTNHGEEAWFDLSMLEALGAVEIETETPWTEGLANFKGVRVKDLMMAVGADGQAFEASALNKYKFDFTGIDYQKYPIIIAWMLNDDLLTVRTLGPLWLMFPFTDYPEIDNEIHRNAAVWQLTRLTVF